MFFLVSEIAISCRNLISKIRAAPDVNRVQLLYQSV